MEYAGGIARRRWIRTMPAAIPLIEVRFIIKTKLKYKGFNCIQVEFDIKSENCVRKSNNIYI